MSKQVWWARRECARARDVVSVGHCAKLALWHPCSSRGFGTDSLLINERPEKQPLTSTSSSFFFLFFPASALLRLTDHTSSSHITDVVLSLFFPPPHHCLLLSEDVCTSRTVQHFHTHSGSLMVQRHIRDAKQSEYMAQRSSPTGYVLRLMDRAHYLIAVSSSLVI